MKRELGDKQRIQHILDAIASIETFLSSMRYEEFLESKIHQSAVERQV